MSEVVSRHTDLSEDDERWLRLLVSEWQLLADLSFSDLVLWVPDRDPNVYWAAAQIRPTTGPTSLFDDVVGDLIAYSPEHLVSGAFVSGEVIQTSEGKLQAGIPVDAHAVPVRLGDRVIAVVRAAHQPARYTRPQLAGAGVPGSRRAPGGDDHRRSLSAARRRDQPGVQPAGGRRVHSDQRGRPGGVREPQRAQRLPPPGPDRRSGRRASADADRGAVPDRRRSGRRLRPVGAVRAQRPPHRTGAPATPT